MTRYFATSARKARFGAETYPARSAFSKRSTSSCRSVMRHAAPMTRTAWRCGRSGTAKKRFRADGSSSTAGLWRSKSLRRGTAQVCARKGRWPRASNEGFRRAERPGLNAIANEVSFPSLFLIRSSSVAPTSFAQGYPTARKNQSRKTWASPSDPIRSGVCLVQCLSAGGDESSRQGDINST